jgi:hypothetical protein
LAIAIFGTGNEVLLVYDDIYDMPMTLRSREVVVLDKEGGRKTQRKAVATARYFRNRFVRSQLSPFHKNCNC